MLTFDEARTRVEHIWGIHRLITLQARPDGGVNVTLRSMGMALDVRERTFSVHQLDADGHASCHEDCRILEAERDTPRPAA